MIQLMETFLSPRPKHLFLKLEVLEYKTDTGLYDNVNQAILDYNLLPNHLYWDANLSIDTEQEVPRQLSLTLANIPTVYGVGIHNWGAFFNPDEKFMWWLDKRVRLSVGLKLDAPVEMGDGTFMEIAWMPKGIYAIVNFESNHSLSEFPAVRLTGNSLECLFTGKRGKFLNPTTLTRHTVAIEAIRTLVSGYIPADTVRFDPSVGLVGDMLEKGDGIASWTAGTNCTISTSPEFMYGVSGKDTSILIEAKTSVPQVLGRKTFTQPFNINNMDSVALWVRTSHNFANSELAIRFIDTDGQKVESGFLQTVGHVIDGEEVVELQLDNWRNILLNLTGFENMSNIIAIEIFLTVAIPKLPNGFKIWIDNIYTAQNKTTLPYELSYGAGTNRWTAVTEIADIIDCDVYFDNDGNFIVRKRRIPKFKDGDYYNYDVYAIPVPVVTFYDQLEFNNIYAGADSSFIEYDLANHTQALGGASYQPIPCLAEFALHADGLHLKEKGMRVNKRGKPRPVDAEWVYNADTNIKELYQNDKKLDTILLDYPKPPAFKAMTDPPIANFAIERIGDMIYHHNNASYDPVIMYVYEAKNRALWELKKRLAYAEQVTVSLAPYYLIEPYDIIRIEDTLLNLKDNYEVRGLDIPLNGDTMSITVHKIRGAALDIPFFDENYTKRSQSWYNYDFYSLAFTFPSWDGKRW